MTAHVTPCGPTAGSTKVGQNAQAGQLQWLTPVIPLLLEAKVRRITSVQEFETRLSNIARSHNLKIKIKKKIHTKQEEIMGKAFLVVSMVRNGQGRARRLRIG